MCRMDGRPWSLVGLVLLAACSADTAERGPANRGVQAPPPPKMAATAGSFANPTMQAPMKPPAVGTTNPMRSCKVTADAEPFELPVCKLKAAPDSFDPKLQWSAELGDGFGPPLVANLTDDNGDGAIDLCDTPDVIVVAGFE